MHQVVDLPYLKVSYQILTPGTKLELIDKEPIS
ncbi:hypothetical protein SAMN06265367_103305 [Algoriphagus winogradskyi]|uniref:Uncharacterized protein n=1 Tax=Algoriphagus winogradskyi TaxID=237017 RepID=A0ABY1NXR1_9BACT|nr:hypothetical protein SAMN06265367_103305 [Algoriphagus winogradskyi]